MMMMVIMTKGIKPSHHHRCHCSSNNNNASHFFFIFFFFLYIFGSFLILSLLIQRCYWATALEFDEGMDAERNVDRTLSVSAS